MKKTLLKNAVRILTLACLAPLCAWGDQPASLIVKQDRATKWVLGIVDMSMMCGKVKIFGEEPAYDEDGHVTTAVLATLRNKGDEFETSLLPNKYWLIFYPKFTALNLTVNFRPKGKNPSEAGTLNVKQSIWKKGSIPLEVKASDAGNVKLQPNVDNFEDSSSPLLTFSSN
jgi:hypothetical protein